MSPERIGPENAGCWLEGSRGWRASGQLVEIAESLGMPVTPDEKLAVTAFLAGETETIQTALYGVIDPTEWVIGQSELADKAEQWLNEHIAPEGYSFGWYDGEFFLWPNADWNEDCDGSCIERPHRWSPSGARCVRTGCRVAGTGDPCNDGNCEGTD